MTAMSMPPLADPSRDDAVQWIMHALTPMLRPGVNEDGRLQLPGDGELDTARRLVEKIVVALEEAETMLEAAYDEAGRPRPHDQKLEDWCEDLARRTTPSHSCDTCRWGSPEVCGHRCAPPTSADMHGVDCWESRTTPSQSGGE